MDFGAEMELSSLQQSRNLYIPELPPCLQGSGVRVELGEATSSEDPSDAQAVSQLFPLTYGQPLIHFLNPPKEAANHPATKDMPLVRVGILFSGRQSPGGHNVVCGLYDAIKSHNPKSTLLGFCGGTEGLFAKKTLEITEDVVSTYRNQGGYNLLGRTKDQIRTTEHVKAALEACRALNLDALVIIGGVTSNTDAAQLAESLAKAKCKTKVVGVPVTLYGDLKNQFVEANVGFDTICKVNAQLISNLCTDALSAEKVSSKHLLENMLSQFGTNFLHTRSRDLQCRCFYFISLMIESQSELREYYYFIRLMGRKASHVTLECALQSNPNMAILGEEVSSSMLTLFDLTKRICDAVQARAEQEKYHGVIILPEGLIGSIPEVHALMQEIHVLQKKGVSDDKISAQLTPWASALFEFLPPFIKKELLLSPDSDDSAPLSQIETEKLLAQLVETEMDNRLKNGTYKGKKFNAIFHFFGYQARGSLPSKFDCDYAYVLGHVSYHLLAAGCNGYMATVTNLKQDIAKWRCGGAPLTAMMSINRLQQGPWISPVGKPSIISAAVDLKGKSYQLLIHNADQLWMNDLYRNPGPIQFEGPGSESKTISLCAEDDDYMGRVKDLQAYLDQVKTIVKPGCSQEVLKAALSSMASVIDVLTLMSSSPSKGQILL